MKKTMQKAVLTALFPIALCSCWNDFGTQTEEKKIPRISILLSAQSGSPMTGERAEEVRSAIENYTQTDVQFYFLSYENYSRRLAEVLKNPADLPMIIQAEKLDYNVAEAVKNGAFWNLQDFIWDEKKYPNLSKMNREVAKTLVLDSSLIGVYRAQDLGRYGFAYRKDWADKLGLSEPKTEEDVYNMLYAFTYVTTGEYIEVKVYDASRDYYVSKDGILYQYNSTVGGMVVIGYEPETNSETATIRRVVKVVEEFSEE